MGDFFIGHYAYWFTIILLCIGLYGILFKKTIGHVTMSSLAMNHYNIARGENYA